MKSSRRFIYDCNLETQEITIADPDLCKQMRNVLRLDIGDVINVCDGKGREAEVRISDMGKNKIQATVLKVLKSGQPDLKKVYVYCSVLKRENFELIIQKCTEIGAAGIVPILTKRTVKSGLKIDRLQKIAKEAAEQCGRLQIPTIGEPRDFAMAIKEAQGEKLFFHLVSSTEKDYLQPSQNTCSLFIGPEGGWDDEEVEIAKQNHAIIMSLGKLSLRAETAAIVASYLIYQNFI